MLAEAIEPLDGRGSKGERVAFEFFKVQQHAVELNEPFTSHSRGVFDLTSSALSGAEESHYYFQRLVRH